MRPLLEVLFLCIFSQILHNDPLLSPLPSSSVLSEPQNGPFSMDIHSANTDMIEEMKELELSKLASSTAQTPTPEPIKKEGQNKDALPTTTLNGCASAPTFALRGNPYLSRLSQQNLMDHASAPIATSEIKESETTENQNEHNSPKMAVVASLQRANSHDSYHRSSRNLTLQITPAIDSQDDHALTPKNGMVSKGDGVEHLEVHHMAMDIEMDLVDDAKSESDVGSFVMYDDEYLDEISPKNKKLSPTNHESTLNTPLTPRGRRESVSLSVPSKSIMSTFRSIFTPHTGHIGRASVSKSTEVSKVRRINSFLMQNGFGSLRDMDVNIGVNAKGTLNRNRKRSTLFDHASAPDISDRLPRTSRMSETLSVSTGHYEMKRHANEVMDTIIEQQSL